jgi:catechol 2,3-dioxygenase-like lactoylglutathione lyase family enzyme
MSILTRGYHHTAFATRDARATYDFYHQKLGLPLVHTEQHRNGDGWFRHFFFDLGEDQLLGFFEFENIGEKPEYRTNVSGGLGTPAWVNHLAFDIGDEERYQTLRQRVLEGGLKIAGETDHDWCKSLYLMDPNGILVEFSYTHRPERFDQSPDEAYRRLFETRPEDIPETARKEA